VDNYYNTGKVKIGKFYTPPRRVLDLGIDAELLQRALLTKPSMGSRLWYRFVRMLYTQT